MNKKQTAMQDLKEDLILTKSSSKDSLSEIKNQNIKDICIEVVEMTLNAIIKRIDDELLEIEKEQIINAYYTGDDDVKDNPDREGEQYYNETFKSE